MLTLKNIGKDYASGQTGIRALRCVNMACRPRELIMVVGPNGSGKSTLLRIIAGQLPFSRGEMLAYGQTVRKFSDNQWSAYRRRVCLADPEGLLHDRTVLENVLLRLRLSGHGRHGRRETAVEMLQFFALESLANRYPADLSAAERKLAALACALVGEPDVLLVDEPVLGLDAASAKKVAGILHETARHCLVVTASRKAIFPEGDVRTVRLKEGTIDSDSDPWPEEKSTSERVGRERGLGFAGVLSVALGSLRRSGTRASARALTAFLAAFCATLVLILTGALVDHSAAVQRSTLSVYPIHITEQTVPADILTGLYEDLTTRSDLPDGTEILPTYDSVPWVFSPVADGTARQVNPTEDGKNLWTELPDDPEIRRARYRLVNGRWPERYDEVVVIQNLQGGYSSLGLASMGLQPDPTTGTYAVPDFDGFLHTTFRLVSPVQTYYPNADGTWGSLRGDMEYMATLMGEVPSLKIVGILRPAENTSDTEEAVFIGYTRAMTAHMTAQVMDSQLVASQKANLTVDILTGLPFDSQGLHSQSMEHKAVAMLDYLMTLDTLQMEQLYREITGQPIGEEDALQILANTVASLTAEEAAALYDKYVASQYSPATYEENMELFGVAAVSRLTELRLYAASLSGRQQLSALLDTYSDTLTYSDDTETMVASAAAFAAGLERARILLCAAAAVCALGAIAAVSAVAVGSRRRVWARLRCCGMGRGELTGICIWESIALHILPAALGTGAAWLFSGTLCRLAGWAQLADRCALPLWQAACLMAILLFVSAMAAAAAVAPAAGCWPGELLEKGKE